MHQIFNPFVWVWLLKICKLWGETLLRERLSFLFLIKEAAADGRAASRSHCGSCMCALSLPIRPKKTSPARLLGGWRRVGLGISVTGHCDDSSMMLLLLFQPSREIRAWTGWSCLWVWSSSSAASQGKLSESIETSEPWFCGVLRFVDIQGLNKEFWLQKVWCIMRIRASVPGKLRSDERISSNSQIRFSRFKKCQIKFYLI